MSNPVVVLGKTYPSYSVVFRTVGIAPRSRKYIEDNYGNVDNFVRRYFPRCTDEEIRAQLDAQLERDKYGADCQRPQFSMFTRDDVKRTVDANAALSVIRDAILKYDFGHGVCSQDAYGMVHNLLEGDFKKELTELLRQATY